MNELLIISGLLGVAYMLRKNKSISGIGRTWYGGNSGYQGYSMSNRAAKAREEGRCPKTDFKKAYGMTETILTALVELGVISNNEWHHTSKYGNKTKFYYWLDDNDIPLFMDNKKEIQELIKNKQYAEVASIFNVDYDDYGTSDVQVGDIIIPRISNEHFVSGKVIDVSPQYITVEEVYSENGLNYTYRPNQQRFLFKRNYEVV